MRQVFDIAVESVQTSCGWGVPYMKLERERATLAKYHAQQDPAERLAKIAGRTSSIDGLPVRVQTLIPECGCGRVNQAQVRAILDFWFSRRLGRLVEAEPDVRRRDRRSASRSSGRSSARMCPSISWARPTRRSPR